MVGLPPVVFRGSRMDAWARDPDHRKERSRGTWQPSWRKSTSARTISGRTAAGTDRQFENSRVGYRAFAAWLQKHQAMRLVVEATGCCHRLVHQILHARGIEVVLANPLPARRFAEAIGRLAKADSIDARMLAAYGAAFPDLPGAPPRDEFLQWLADLLVIRIQHREARMSLRQFAHEIHDGTMQDDTPRSVEILEQQIAKFDRSIQEHIASDPDTHQRYRILVSIPGIGPISAASLGRWMPELGRIGNRQAASLLGVTPFARNSGSLAGARHLRGGRRRSRNMLYMTCSPEAGLPIAREFSDMRLPSTLDHLQRENRG